MKFHLKNHKLLTNKQGQFYFIDTRVEIFEKMHDGPVSERKFYTPSLTKIQRSFIKRDRPAQLKRLIQYVKYWKNTMMQVKVKQHLFLIYSSCTSFDLFVILVCLFVICL